MRRLFASVAVAAAALLAPSAAFATTAPVLAQPASPTKTPIVLTWNDVRTAPPAGTATYGVWRAPAPCAMPDFTQVSLDLVDAFTYTDTPAADGTYCYFVRADDGSGPADSNPVTVAFDTTAPVIVATPTGGDGCTTPFTFVATASDASPPVTLTVDGAPYTAGAVFSPAGAPYAQVSPSVVATDALGTASAPTVVPGRILDPTPPGAASLEVAADPAGQRATLSWEPVAIDGAPLDSYRVRTKGPQGSGSIPVPASTNAITVPISQVDATYEFTLDAKDACGRFGPASVRLVRLSDTSAPSMPIVSGPVLDPVSHVVTLFWVAATDNIQVDHYEILRNGVPLGATDATAFTDVLPTQHAQLSYVVRAVDTNGNSTDSAPAVITTPDWEAPTAPSLSVSLTGSTATLRWSPASDNIGVVGYDVLRDGKQIATMTAAVRTYRDADVPAGVHTWQVRSRDDAGLTAISAPQSAKIAKSGSRASVLGLRLAGSGTGAARYSLKARARLLVDVRVVGTVSKPRLRIYVNSGRTRITLWRGMPGSSALRLRLGSTLARHGFVTIPLNRTLHAGRTRLVLISSGKLVLAGDGAHKPAMTSG